MLDKTTVYVSIESRAGQLVIDGPLPLLKELLAILAERAEPAAERQEVAGAPVPDRGRWSVRPAEPSRAGGTAPEADLGSLAAALAELLAEFWWRHVEHEGATSSCSGGKEVVNSTDTHPGHDDAPAGTGASLSESTNP